MSEFARLLTAIDDNLDLGDDPRKFAEKFRPVDREQMQVVLGGGPAENKTWEEPAPTVTITKVPDSYGDAKAKILARNPQAFDRGSQFDDLGAAAAFTQNPALMQMWQHRAERGDKDRQFALAAAREARNARDSDFDFGEKKASSPFKLQALKNNAESEGMDLDVKRAAFDPQSAYSQTIREGLATQLNGFADTLKQRGAPQSAIYADAAQKLMANPNLNAQQMISGVKPLADAAGFNLSALHDQATEANAKAQLGQGWAHIAAARDNVQASRDDRQANRADMTEQRAAAAQDKKDSLLPTGPEAARYADRKEALRKIARAEQLLGSGKIRYLGGGAGMMNSIMSKAPDFTGLDKRTPEERELANLVQWIAAPERHELFGSSLTPGEKAVGDELLGNINRNESSVRESLKNMKQGAANKNSEMKKLYPGLGKLDAPAAAPKQANAPVSKKPAPHGQRVEQDGHAFEWNGTKYVEVQ